MDVKIIHSKRKTISIQISSDLSIIVRAPMRISKKEIDRILKEKEDWIKFHIEKMKQKNEQYEANKKQELTKEEIKKLADEALNYIPGRVRYYADLTGIEYGRITIRNQKTRWGSCSSKGNLNFNCLLMLTNKDVIDYVVVHELCHRKQMNHSKKFWLEVEKILPDYKKHRKWLKENGNDIIKLMGF